MRFHAWERCDEYICTMRLHWGSTTSLQIPHVTGSYSLCNSIYCYLPKNTFTLPFCSLYMLFLPPAPVHCVYPLEPTGCEWIRGFFREARTFFRNLNSMPRGFPDCSREEKTPLRDGKSQLQLPLGIFEPIKLHFQKKQLNLWWVCQSLRPCRFSRRRRIILSYLIIDSPFVNSFKVTAYMLGVEIWPGQISLNDIVARHHTNVGVAHYKLAEHFDAMILKTK